MIYFVRADVAQEIFVEIRRILSTFFFIFLELSKI